VPEEPPFQQAGEAAPQPFAAARRSKKRNPRLLGGPPAAVEHHRDDVPQLEDEFFNIGRHGRQANAPRSVPVSPRRYPIKSPNPESKKFASAVPGADGPKEKPPKRGDTYEPKGDNGKEKWSEYAAGNGPQYSLDDLE